MDHQWTLIGRVVDRLLCLDAWTEEDHPRGEGGKFSKTFSAHTKAFQKHREKKNKAEERAKNSKAGLLKQAAEKGATAKKSWTKAQIQASIEKHFGVKSISSKEKEASKLAEPTKSAKVETPKAEKGSESVTSQPNTEQGWIDFATAKGSEYTKAARNMGKMSRADAERLVDQAKADWKSIDRASAKGIIESDPRKGRPHSGVLQAAWQHLKEEFDSLDDMRNGPWQKATAAKR